MKEYVAGFMFNVARPECILLVRKNKPEWQRGKLNAIGGKIEPGETPIQAMVREFREETSIEKCDSQWVQFCTLEGYTGFAPYRVYFFAAEGETGLAQTVTDEEIVEYYEGSVTTHNAIPNLQWLIPMGRLALRGKHQHVTVVES